MNTCSFTMHFKKIIVCSKVLVQCFKKLYANTCLSTMMNSVGALNKKCCYG